MKEKFLPFMLFFVLAGCGDKKNDEVIGEVEENIRMELPSNTSILDHEARGDSNNYYSATNLSIRDQQEMEDLVQRIIKSDEFIGKDKIPSYWSRQQNCYVYERIEMNGTRVSCSIDTVNKRLGFKLKEKK